VIASLRVLSLALASMLGLTREIRGFRDLIAPSRVGALPARGVAPPGGGTVAAMAAERTLGGGLDLRGDLLY